MKSLAVLFLAATFVQITLAFFPDPSKEYSVHQPLHDAGEKLFLTPYIEANKIKEAQAAAKVHLKDFQNVTSYSGYFTVDKKNNGNLFSWFFPSANDYAKDPVLLWLQGGPAITSLFGLFAEHGPFRVVNGSIQLRNISWHKNYSVLYIDQPVGTGFSFTEGEFVTDETQVAEHLYSALTQFFTLFPQIQKNEFYLAGESYAGKYVPAIGYAIHQKNPTASLKINLQGLIIINGFTDPIHQLNLGDLLYQIGLVDANALEEFHSTEKLAVDFIEKGLYHNASDNWFKIILTLYPKYSGLKSFYNYLLDVDDNPTEYEQFVTQDRVRRAIHVGNQSFTIQNRDVYNALYADVTRSVAPWISELLSHYRVLIFSGELDVAVPYVQTENYLQKLNFSAADDYKIAFRRVWQINNIVAGYVKTAGNLTEALVRGAGHMVPKDQPERAFELVTKFTNKEPIVIH